MMYKCKSTECRLRRTCERSLSYVPDIEPENECQLFIDQMECIAGGWHFYADILKLPLITIPTRQWNA